MDEDENKEMQIYVDNDDQEEDAVILRGKDVRVEENNHGNYFNEEMEETPSM